MFLVPGWTPGLPGFCVVFKNVSGRAHRLSVLLSGKPRLLPRSSVAERTLMGLGCVSYSGQNLEHDRQPDMKLTKTITASLGIGLALLSVLVRPGQALPKAATDPAPSNRAPQVAVAVLPFKNATGEPSLEHWRIGFEDCL